MVDEWCGLAPPRPTEAPHIAVDQTISSPSYFKVRINTDSFSDAHGPLIKYALIVVQQQLDNDYTINANITPPMVGRFIHSKAILLFNVINLLAE